ncbi:hypothetical protein RB195_006635 [Necator americanus]
MLQYILHGIFIVVVGLITIAIRRALGEEYSKLLRKMQMMKKNEFIDRTSLHDKILTELIQKKKKRSSASSKTILAAQ